MIPRSRALRSAVAVVALAVSFVVPSTAVFAVQSRVVVATPGAVPRADVIVPGSIATHFDVVLHQRNAGALSGFLASLYTHGSANYHHFLTPAAFARRFGATNTAVTAVTDYFGTYGLRVTAHNRARTVLTLSGSTTEISRAFATPVDVVRTPSGSVAAEFARPASVPASLAGALRSVVGLSSLTPSFPHVALTRAHATAAAGPTSCPSAGDATTNGPNSLYGYTAQQQAEIYGLSSAWATGNTGVGQTIALYELGLPSLSDVSTYFHCYGVSPTVSSVNVDGGPSGGPIDEATLDVEEAGVLAPGAHLVVYQGPNSNTGPLDVYSRIADDNSANVVSVSWGTCETDPNGSVTGEQVIFEQMAAQGQSVLASAGDSGSSDCNGGSSSSTALAVDDPASQPFVTGVGGLTVSSISPLIESVWNHQAGSNSCDSSSGSGGGQSVIWSRPSWQVAPGISPSDTMRMVPDLSVMGDPSTGFIQYFPNSGNCSSPAWFSIGGTSIGSPLVSALVAVATQACNAGRLGFLNPQLYHMPSSDFVDVTTGNNDVFGAGGYSAGPGYDMASGLGSPNGTAFLNGLCPSAMVDPSASTFSATATARAGSSDATVNATLVSSSGTPLVNSQVTITASAPGGTLTIDGDPASSTSPGRASYNVTSDTSGSLNISVGSSRAQRVDVTLTYQGAQIYTTSLNFLANPRLRPTTPKIAALVALVGGFQVRVAPLSSRAGRVTYQYWTNASGRWITIRGNVVTVSNLVRGRAYVVRVRAIDHAGPSQPSPVRRVVTKL